jgi:glycosyltransferase involved in cell wall biosynthesis
MNRPKPERPTPVEGDGNNDKRPRKRHPRPNRSPKVDSANASEDAKPERRQSNRPKRKPSRKEESSTTDKVESKKEERPNRKKGKPKYSNKPLISVVIPTYNEEESLTELSNLLEKVLSRETKNNYEVLFIDDGSTDSTFSVMREINKKNPKFRAIRFRRNYGKSAALSVGFKAAKGAVIITMDADLQDDPMEIPNLMSKIRDGYDVVSGWKKKRNDPINKTLPSKFFNFVTAKASGLKLHDFNCGLKAYRSEAAKSLDIYGEMHRYLPVLAHWNGFRITEIPVKHHPRKHGKTKFGASRYVKGFLDLITLLFTSRYLKRPLHFFGTVGTLMGLVGFGIDAWLTVEWIMGETFLSNRPAALLGIALIIVGVQLVSLGLLGEMIVKNFKRDEEYQIRENL